jgi:hypothetical protein
MKRLHSSSKADISWSHHLTSQQIFSFQQPLIYLMKRLHRSSKAHISWSHHLTSQQIFTRVEMILGAVVILCRHAPTHQRPVGARGDGSAMAHPDFGRLVNPISTRWGGADYAHHITTCPPPSASEQGVPYRSVNHISTRVQIMPTKLLLLPPPDFLTFLRPCTTATVL